MPKDSHRHPSPIIKWAGGKAGLLSQLMRLMPEGVGSGFEGRLVEPFVGGAAMFLWLRPGQALLADSNPELIDLYRAVRNDFDELVKWLDWYQDRPHTPEEYYDQRRDEPQDPVRRAARLVYLNKNCFNGLYRLNRAGKFNVPFGRYGSKPTLYNPANLRAVRDLLQTVDNPVTQSFERTLEQLRPGDFVYLDPPYYPLNPTSSFTSYTAQGFGLRQQELLRDAIVTAASDAECRVSIMLSNSSASGLRDLYEDSLRAGLLFLHDVDAVRSVGAKSAWRGVVKEVAIVNYPVRPRDAGADL